MQNIPSRFYTETVLSACESKLETLPLAIGNRVKFLFIPCVDPRMQLVHPGTLTAFPTLGALIPPFKDESRLAEDIGTAMFVNPNARNIVVMGHNDCKAVEWLIRFIVDGATPPFPIASRFHAMDWLNDGYYKELEFAVRQTRGAENYISNWRHAIDWVTLNSAKNLLDYRVGAQGETLAELIDTDEQNTINIIPAFNNLNAGGIELYDPVQRTCVEPKLVTKSWVEKAKAGSVKPRSELVRKELEHGQQSIVNSILSREYLTQQEIALA